MNMKEQATQTEYNRRNVRVNRCLTGNNALHLLSSLLLPLILGIFTVIITFEQQRLARQQWLVDKNESRVQREQELQIAIDERAVQTRMNQERYKDELLVAYIKEIGDMLRENNGSLTSNKLIHILARAKTINAIGQLDGFRQTLILRFLYEADQLTPTGRYDTLDISTAEFAHIDYEKFKELSNIKRISLVGVHLINCSFVSYGIGLMDLSFTRLYNVNFSYADIQQIKSSSARLSLVTFSSAQLRNINFSESTLMNVTFLSAQLFQVTFSHARFAKVSFLSAQFKNVDFSFADFSNKIGKSNFDYTQIANAIFRKCICEQVDFIHANLKNSSFDGARLTGVDFTGANLQNVDFTGAHITDEQLSRALSIRGAILPNGTIARGQNLIKNDQFVHRSDDVMIQQISLTNIWNSSLWTQSNIELKTRINDEVSIALHGLASNGTILKSISLPLTYNSTQMGLTNDMKMIEIIVKLLKTPSTTHRWCDNIELFIDYDHSLS